MVLLSSQGQDWHMHGNSLQEQRMYFSTYSPVTVVSAAKCLPFAITLKTKEIPPCSSVSKQTLIPLVCFFVFCFVFFFLLCSCVIKTIKHCSLNYKGIPICCAVYNKCTWSTEQKWEMNFLPSSDLLITRKNFHPLYIFYMPNCASSENHSAKSSMEAKGETLWIQHVTAQPSNNTGVFSGSVPTPCLPSILAEHQSSWAASAMPRCKFPALFLQENEGWCMTCDILEEWN